MNNVILIVSMFVHLGHLTKDQGAKVVENLRYETIPDSFEEAFRLVKIAFDKADVNVSKDIHELLVGGKKVKVSK